MNILPSFQFEKGVSPIEFYKPDELSKIIEQISRKQMEFKGDS
jgi:hypothetical protein